MKIAIMQPYFFPYIGYFQLINSTNRFILFDDVQYIRHGWINRNQVLKPTEAGPSYITASLAKHSSQAIIRDIQVSEQAEWKEKIIRQLDHYRKRSPFYKQTIDVLRNCFATQEKSITGFNGHCLKTVCDYLGVNFKIEISSQMNFDYSTVSGPGEWALRICEQLQASEYINPSGGMQLFDRTKYEGSNIQLGFLQTGITEYNQYRGYFEPSLSIIDVMMFNSTQDIGEMLKNYQLV